MAVIPWGNGLGGDHDDLFILGQFPGLVGGQDDVLVVGVDENGLGVYLADGVQHIFRTGIHGLASLDEIVHSQLRKDPAESFAHRYGDKTCLFFRLGRRLFRLLRGQALRVPYDFLVVFFPHVVDLHTGQRTVGKRFLKGKAGIVGMYVYLYDLVVRHHHHRISDGHKVVLQFLLLASGEGFVQHYDKFRTVTEFDIRFPRGSADSF